ncbi:hypothetical protein S245_001273, partial [Arachis hypogaea]
NNQCWWAHVESNKQNRAFYSKTSLPLEIYFSKGAKNHEMTARSMFGLESSGPLVTFALSYGTLSSSA